MSISANGRNAAAPAVQAAPGSTPPSEEQVRKRLLEALSSIGKQVTSEDSIRYEGTSFTIPVSMRGNLAEAIRYLRSVQEGEEKVITFQRIFPYRPFDGAAAFSRAMTRVFGGQGVGVEYQTIFGKEPPRLLSIETGIGQHTDVPWGKIALSMLQTTFQIGAAPHAELGSCSCVSAEAPKKYRYQIDGFFDVVEEELRNASIYRGNAVTAAPTPSFLDPFTVPRDKVVYSDLVMRQLNAMIWTPIRHAQRLRDDGWSLKRAVLLEGPYGSGKSLAGLLTAQVAIENGFTFILVRADEDPLAALRTAQMYAPAVVLIEDLDVLAANKTREQMVSLLDALDSVSVKDKEIMAVFTTNFLGDIDQAVLRPGRIDAVIRIAELDQGGYERLIRSLVPAGQLAADINYASIAEAYREFLPAFAAETTRRAMLYSIARGDGSPQPLSTQDLLDAATAMREQLHIMNAAREAPRSKPTLDRLVEEAAAEALRRTYLDGERMEVVEATTA